MRWPGTTNCANNSFPHDTPLIRTEPKRRDPYYLLLFAGYVFGASVLSLLFIKYLSTL